MSSRNGHYFMWFVVFGLIAGIVSFVGEHVLSGEAIWLLASGILGWLIAREQLNQGKLARYYDYIIGVIFMLAGLLGVVHLADASLLNPIANNLGSVMSGSGESATILGLSLGLFPSIVHLLLGFTSFRHGMNNSKK